MSRRTLSLEQFRATRKRNETAVAEITGGAFEEEIEAGQYTACYVYECGAYILICADGSLFLPTIHEDHSGSADQLPALEERLFNFTADEGYFRRAPRSLEQMTEAFATWRAENGFANFAGDAEELMREPRLTDLQHAWLQSFCEEWEGAQERFARVTAASAESAIMLALRIAKEKYETLALDRSQPTRVWQQFQKQAHEARLIAEMIEEGSLRIESAKEEA